MHVHLCQPCRLLPLMISAAMAQLAHQAVGARCRDPLLQVRLNLCAYTLQGAAVLRHLCRERPPQPLAVGNQRLGGRDAVCALAAPHVGVGQGGAAGGGADGVGWSCGGGGGRGAGGECLLVQADGCFLQCYMSVLQQW